MDVERLSQNAMDDTLPVFLTTEEVLGWLKVTPRTIYRLIRAGDLPAVRVGRQWRFRRADLENWLAARAPSMPAASSR
jgi:excisionase family DNA binding protein